MDYSIIAVVAATPIVLWGLRKMFNGLWSLFPEGRFKDMAHGGRKRPDINSLRGGLK